MKAIKRISAVFLAVIMVFAMSGCSQIAGMFESREMRTNTENMLDAVVCDDIVSAYVIVDEICTADAFLTVFDNMKTMLADVENYDLSVISANRKTSLSGGQRTEVSTAAYRMTTNAGTYIIDVQMVSTSSDLYSFYITPIELTDHYSTGTVDNMKGATVFQWIMLLSNILVAGFVIFAFVDCCRRKIGAKALWLILIAVGFAAITVTVGAAKFGINFGLGWFFSYSAFVEYGGGTTMFRLLLPLGAILYFIFRNTLIGRAILRERAIQKKAEEAAAKEEQNPEETEEKSEQ